jgi:DNA-binding response OmpR family regulator
MKYRILYAEDEPFLAQITSDNLKLKGYEVLLATNGADALALFKAHQPDLCLLDIMMPLKDGYTLANDIKQLNAEVPIIFLSAKSMPEDVVKGFKSGGHDYLKKPFSIAELLVRIESLLMRFGKVPAAQPSAKQTVYTFGQCRLDTVTQRLQTPVKLYDLSFKEMELLKMLLQFQNQVLERQQALQTIWGDDNYYNANSMTVFVAHLRKMLRDDPQIQVLNIRGIGYKLIC